MVMGCLAAGAEHTGDEIEIASRARMNVWLDPRSTISTR
jgi:hypothetical protein